MMRRQFCELWVRSLGKVELNELIADVKRGEVEALKKAVVFVTAESFGIWHNRARAKLSRYFKNRPPAEHQRRALVVAIVCRLVEGRFYEQFKDQLSMAIRFDRTRLEQVAIQAGDSDKEYSCRYAAWISQTIRSLPKEVESR